MVVYHWKKTFEEIKASRLAGFSTFVKLQTRKSGRLIISLYLFMAFLLGVTGSLTASVFLYLIGSNS